MTEDWKSKEEARILLIGHDPRLQKSDTEAKYVLFANYFFEEIPKPISEKQKYGLAKSTFDYIAYLTLNKFKPENIYITNLCNDALVHAPKGRTVLIPKDKAEKGLNNINKILLKNQSIEYIFPMSLQVNYWLQKLDFYNSNDDFLKLSEPKEKGLKNNPPYFEVQTKRTFQMICGKEFSINNGKHKVIPILHVKNYPLKGRFLDAYGDKYKETINIFKNKNK
jgi:hypothetical protein